MSLKGDSTQKVVYWHRELPPPDGEVMHEHVIEAMSNRVSGAIERHGELWHRCYVALMEATQIRLEQEVRRLGGDYAHVLDEHIDSRRDEANGEAGSMVASITYFIGGLAPE